MCTCKFKINLKKKMTTPEEKALEWKSEGNKCLRDKKYDEAIKAYTNALELDGNSYLYYCNRSAARILKKDEDELWGAVKDARKCVDINPKYAKGYLNLASALMRQKKEHDAVAVLRKGLENIKNDENLKKKLATCEKLIKQKSLYYMFWSSSHEAKKNTLNLPLHIIIVILASTFALTGSGTAYGNTILCAVAVTFANLVGTHGSPRFSKYYAMNIIQDPNTNNLMLCAILYTSIHSILGIFALTSMSFVHVATTLYKILVSKVPSLARRLAGLVNIAISKFGGPSSWSTLPFNTKLYRFCLGVCYYNAAAIVGLGFIRVAQILLARQGSFLSVFLFWQYIRMSVMLEQTRGNSKQFTSVFQTIDIRVSSITSRGPSIVHTAYLKLRSALITFGSPPTAPSSSAAGGGGGGSSGLFSRCVVM